MNPVVMVAVVGAVASIAGALLGAGVTFSMNRANASKYLAEAQAAAQKVALDSASATRVELEARYGRCESQVQKLEAATSGLVDAIESFTDDPAIRAVIDMAEPQTRLTLRAAIWAARQAV